MKIPRPEDFRAYFESEVWLAAAREICLRHKLAADTLKRAAHGESVVVLIDDRYVVKFYVPPKHALEREKRSLEIARTDFKIPEIVAFGEIEEYKYLVSTQIAGEQINHEMWLALDRKEQISILRQLAEGLLKLHRSDASRIEFDWNEFVRRQAETCFERQKACRVNERVLARIPDFLEENLKLLPASLPQVFLHGDVHFGNLRFLPFENGWRISGLFDFADSLKGFHEYDFLAVGVLMIQGQGDLQREFFRFFGYADADMDETMQRRLMLLTMFYEWSDLRRYAVRLRPEAVDYSFDRLMREIWNFV